MDILGIYILGGIPIYLMLMIHLWRNMWDVKTPDFFGLLLISILPIARELLSIALMIENNRNFHGGVVFKRYEK